MIDLYMRQIRSPEVLRDILLRYDNSAVRTISSRVKDMDQYAKKLSEYAQNFEVYIGNEAVGFISFYSNDVSHRRAYLTIIALERNFRRGGTGSKMLQYMERACKKKGLNKIRLEVDKGNDSAIRFYRKNGFEQTTDASEYSFYMEKEI